MKAFIFMILTFFYGCSADIDDSNSSNITSLAKSKLGSPYKYGKAG